MQFHLLVLSLLSLVSALSQVDSLKKLASKNNGIVPLTTKNFNKILPSKEDAYLLVLLTATNPEVACQVCKEYDDDFKAIASAWAQQDDSRNLFFVRSDYINKADQGVFQHFKVDNVPRLMLFGPNGDMAFDSVTIPMEDRLKFTLNAITQKTGIVVNYQEPVNYGTLVSTAVLTFLIVLLLKKRFQWVKALGTKSYLWGAISCFFIIILIAGYMFNEIRGSPMYQTRKDGSISYFMENQQMNQFAIETQVVSVLYGLLGVGVVMLCTVVPAMQKQQPKWFAASTLAFVVIGFFVYASLMGVFGLKSQGYPFRLIKLSAFF